MSAFETSTIVSGHGEIHLAGLPFQPGTEVEVVVSPKNGAQTATAPERLATLLSALNHAHNTDPIGSLERDELYDRDTLR
ncbi:MAG: hypothetical protein WD738_05315 [Pirellulales bacterium]